MKMQNDKLHPEQDELLALREEKEVLRKKIRASRNKMSKTTHAIFAPIPKTKSKVEGVSHLVGNGLVIWNGVKIGISLVTAVRSMFGHRRR